MATATDEPAAATATATNAVAMATSTDESAAVAAAAVAMATAADQPTPTAPIEKECSTAPVKMLVEVHGAETKLCGLRTRNGRRELSRGGGPSNHVTVPTATLSIGWSSLRCGDPERNVTR